MSDIDAMLTAQAGQKSQSIDDMLQARAGGGMAPAAPITPKAPSAGARFTQGITDAPVAFGQLAEHTAGLNTITSGWRQLIGGAIRTAAGDPDSGTHKAGQSFNESPWQRLGGAFGDVSTEDYDNIVRKRESDYQQARTAAGQTGIDWWRLGGQAANPIYYMAPGGAAAGVAGRIGQAAVQGGVSGLSQASTSPDNYWWDKSKDVIGGMALGAGAGTFVEGLTSGASKLMRAGVNKAREVLGANAADTTAAESVVNDALHARGVDPNTINPNILAGMKQEAQAALKHGSDISDAAIANRSVAESLPVPIKLMQGQATRDPMLFAKEQNLRGVDGVGEGITQRLQEQNQGFIANLDALGAKDAADPVEAGNQIHASLQNAWDAMQDQKTQLYDAVKNSQGQSAWMNVTDAAKDIRETMGSPSGPADYYFLPDPIKDTLTQMESGELPLTVSQFQALDKKWGGMAANASDGNVRNAIYTAREMLGQAPLGEDAGEQSMQAYQAAKQAHAQQMSLINPKSLNGQPNQAFQPLMKAVVVDGKAPETLFKTHFMNAAASDAGDNLKFLASVDPNAQKMIGDTLIGEIKRQALGKASDENGTVSQVVLNDWANNPYKAATMKALGGEPRQQTYNALAKTIENAKLAPTASVINYSGTAPTLMNMAGSAIKSGVAAQVAKKVPFVKTGMEIKGAYDTAKAGEAALNPGVSLKSLASKTKTAARNRTLSRLAVPGAVAAEETDNSPPQ